MQRGQAVPVTALVFSAALALGAAFVPTARAAEPVVSDTRRGAAYTFAVIGDVPYDDDALEDFPTFIGGINDDPQVRLVAHLGDVKSGSTTCDDELLTAVRRDFDLFTDPLVYTPGDNEWADCHRANNGFYGPLERLAKVRSLFFDRPGWTLGRRTAVHSQAGRGVPENVRFIRAGVSFATLHVVGSNDDLVPWAGLGNITPTRAQVAEERHRMAAAVANLRAAFARGYDARTVALMQQADMFYSAVPNPRPADYSAFRPLVQAMVDEARDFDGPVYLLNGDSHQFTQDRPLAAGSRWLSFYGVRGSANNLRRVTVDGAELGEETWLKVTVQQHGREALTFEKVPAD